MDLADIMSQIPYCRHLGIEVTTAEDGHAEGELAFDDHHSSVPGSDVAHGAVVHGLADTVAGAAVISLHHRPTPTIDIRFDHLAPARGDLHAEADVRKDGDTVAVADVKITHDDTLVATARGTFKTAGDVDGSAWSESTRLGDDAD
ncbi:PaaI family thioesterase [Halorubellus sp. PRR65]|uniref:PaaI family thioesterase n=1 Tax=Halorubellus sp. PRR65 TaxID=3098148 RepID=UPI002B261969|nr:PaaI family thioesterase [Halorubellus sp. PRR65]